LLTHSHRFDGSDCFPMHFLAEVLDCADSCYSPVDVFSYNAKNISQKIAK